MEEMVDAYGLWRKGIGLGGFDVPYAVDDSAEITGEYDIRAVDVYGAFYFKISTLRTQDKRLPCSNDAGHREHYLHR